MLRAYNNETKKIIEAFAVGIDPSYQVELNKNSWYVIESEIENYEEVLKKSKEINNIDYIPCSFIKSHYREYPNEETQDKVMTEVVPHFRIPNAHELGVKYISESQDHKDIKEFFYNHILNNKDFVFIVSNADVNNYPIKYEYTMDELYKLIDFESIKTSTAGFGLPFEITTTDLYNTRRVDILLPFKEKHHELGIGLAVEIQLSKQSDELEQERTIDRALKGLSVCWINFKHFDTFYDGKKLKATKPLKLITEKRTYIKTQKSILSSLETKAIQTLQDCARKIDEKKEKALAELRTQTVAGLKCPKCSRGVITKTKVGNGLYCTERPNCKFWVNL